MNKLISLFLLMSLFSNITYADCNWKTDITDGPNHTHIYSDACHLAVGALVQQAPIQAQQIQDLTQAVQLKNAALLTSDQRTELWIKNSQDSEDRLLKMNSDQKTNQWLMFGLGALTVIGTGWMVSQFIHH